jgi:zinc protease
MKKIYSLSIVAAVLFLVACSPKVDRSHAPAAGPAPVIQIGQAQQFQLANGLKVIVVENHKLPTVSYSITLDLDPVSEGSKAGYVSMAGELLKSGTNTRSKAQIDEAVDYIGASLNSSASGVGGSCLVKHSENFLDIMSDVLLNPSFPEDEIQKSIKQGLSGLASAKTDPNSISENITSIMNYGGNHPYGELVTETSMSAIQRNDLVSYYNTNFKPGSAYMVIVGDITLDKAKSQAEKYFGSWKGDAVAARAYDKPAAPAANRVGFVPVPGAVQSVIDVTYPIDLKPGTQDAIVASVLNNILGGSGFQARLMQNLREDKAYTYGAYSSISPDEVIGSFSAGASVRNEVTDSAVTQILIEMDRLVKEPVPDSTLTTIKNIMNGSFARSLERPQTIANFALNIERYKLPKDFYQTYLQKLNTVTAADVQAMAKRIIKPSNCNITVVGNKDVAAKLTSFAGNGKVEMFNYDGTPYSELKPAPAGLTATDVLKKYIDALGGETLLASVKSYEQTGALSMSGMSLQMTLKVKDGSKMLHTMKMGPMEVMKRVYDGKKGQSSGMGQPTELMDEGALGESKLQCDMLGELHYAQYGITPVLKGIDTVNGEDAYLIELQKPDGSSSSDYFSVKTGLRIKSVATEGEGEEMQLIETYYTEYAETGGVKYVSKMTQSAAGQQMEFTYDKMILNPVIADSEFAVE